MNDTLEELQKRRDETAKTLAELDERIEEARKAEAEQAQWFYCRDYDSNLRMSRDGRVMKFWGGQWRDQTDPFDVRRIHAALFDAAMTPRVDVEGIAGRYGVFLDGVILRSPAENPLNIVNFAREILRAAREAKGDA